MLETLFLILMGLLGKLFTSEEQYRELVKEELHRGLEDGSIKANMERR